MTTNDTPRLMAQLALRLALAKDRELFDSMSKGNERIEDLLMEAVAGRIEPYLVENGYEDVNEFMNDFWKEWNEKQEVTSSPATSSPA